MSSRFIEIREMSVSELIHTMLCEFDPKLKAKDETCEGVFLQSETYCFAAERLDEIFKFVVRP